MSGIKPQQEAQDIALRAIEIARDYRHEMTTLEHVLAALLETPDVQKFMTSLGIEAKTIADAIEAFFVGGFIEQSHDGNPMKTVNFESLFIRVIGASLFSSRKAATPMDVLLHLAQFPHEDCHAVTALLNAKITPFEIKRYIAHGQPMGSMASPQPVRPDGMPAPEVAPTNRAEAVKFIERFASNLNDKARKGKIDPVIWRAEELLQTMQILSRRAKNNAIYVGDPGVGKTSLAEGLAYNIVKGEVPALLKNATVWSLDIGALVAGTRFRGDFEERIGLVLKALGFLSEPLPDGDPKSPELSVLFIDEIHTIMDAGAGSKGSLDVGNMLKPALAKGTLRCIGSTTVEEYRKYFEKDRALARRFKKVQIDEPSPELTKAILRGLRNIYETYHNITYTDAALDAAVDLTHRHIHTALLPDKAIDIIDQAGATQRVFPEGERLTVIDVEQIEAEVSKVVLIPVQDMTEDDTAKLSRLEDDLEAAVFGQPKALRALTDAVLISRSGLREENLPAGSYLFAGPTGCGKTECARQLAKTLDIPLIKFDMSEYMEEHSVSKLIGAPPGYVGFGDGVAGDGLLVNAIDTNPSCVLLLDEIEKAHPNLFNILLQVMDDAKLTNSQGKTVHFNNVILIMTSNVGVGSTEATTIGFGRETKGAEFDAKAIQRLFKPEFRNRLDAVIQFDPLKPEVMIRIVDKFLASLRALAGHRNVAIKASQSARDWLAKAGYDPVFGARPLARIISEHVKKPLSRAILFGELRSGGTARIGCSQGVLTVKSSPL